MPTEHYSEHLRVRRERAAAALEATDHGALVLHSGTPLRYFADDQDAPFHPTPHFAHWVPLAGPHHLLLVRPGERPRLVRVAPEDYWYERPELGDPFWARGFELVEVGSPEEAWRALGAPAGAAFVGEPAVGIAAGFAPERIAPPELVARLDWDRSSKTDYEVACIEEAGRKAGSGHRAAREAFEAGGSELEVHQAYVRAVGCTDEELPYPTIVGIDAKGAILHYTGKRRERGGRSLLIDAGAAHLGYCSDVTRTWTRAGCEPEFRALVEGLDAAQRELCARVLPGLPYAELHHRAHVAIADLLQERGVLRAGGEEAVESGLTRPFFPHGLGHFLGIQVHDVAGRQAAPEGGELPPPAGHPFLRTTRTIEPGQVFTIEPGIYFIEMLLREHRSGPLARQIDWERVERLAPFGGVRVEDDVLVTEDGHRNLTRPYA